MPKPTLKCSKCKEEFLRAEIIRYTPEGCKTEYKLCKKCYEEKINNEKFFKAIENIYGNKPSPAMIQQKKRIQDKFGYAVDIIIDTLYYLSNVKGLKNPNLGKIDDWPKWVKDMTQYKRSATARENLIKNMAQHEYKYKYIQIKENEEKEEKLDNLDDYLW